MLVKTPGQTGDNYDLSDATNDSMQEFVAKVRNCVKRILNLNDSIPESYTPERRTAGWESGEFPTI